MQWSGCVALRAVVFHCARFNAGEPSTWSVHVMAWWQAVGPDQVVIRLSLARVISENGVYQIPSHVTLPGVR